MQLRSLGVNTNTFLLLALSLLFAANVKAAFVKVGEFELQYEIAGSGKQIVVLEAGGSAGLDDWNSVFSSIAEQTKVIRYSRVGNGNSTAIKRHFTSMEYADHLSEFLLALDISEPIVLAAHSYGGSVARDFAAKYPQQLNALLMLDPSSEHDVDILRAINLEQGNKEIAQIKLSDMENGMSNQYLDFWSKRPLPDYPQIKDMPVTVIASVRKVAEPSNLFFTDKGRMMWGEMWQNWAAEFPQGRSVLTEKSGHFIQNDEPMLVLRELKRLMKILDENKQP
ncbi:alpha/beta fold hydrolase [Pseudoalteromonas sp. KG3]|uniref:alpha/beta fold hydrolase n=1 Tax=Pseudoalteromonas sp. KG3 TaxID=2951137 RepID=UPI00265AC3B1|nr:alpha/beta hydrolase [Pseudoalteromonas sp. KG3]WKD25873.1 alpha/beta fold hydrolase [Pseudoalteromonas sp. KG3]